jgi:hypothetical protein
MSLFQRIKDALTEPKRKRERKLATRHERDLEMVRQETYQAMRPRPKDYKPYSHRKEFFQGVHAYRDGVNVNPYDSDSVEAQAWDRGLEYGMRMFRWQVGLG